MVSFDEKLKSLLKTEESFVDQDGELLEGRLQNAARNADEKLINLLITEEEIRNKFFSEIAGYKVFNGNLFIDYIGNKNFLDNSYTKYKNKIGLQSNGKFLKENGDISLVRPFKDCVLEGGQTKEEDERHEIFFNEVLAQDEIDKLFAPKVLTNFKKYDKDGEHKIEGFNRDENGIIKDNLIIKGNNLLALYSLKKEFEGQVKCIYIDVPYNTGNDSFGYNDNFNHSTRLTFMKNRLEIAKKLLKKDGVILIECDKNEDAYLKVLCDEIFLRDNFINSITIQSSTPSGQKLAHKNKTILKTKDTILVYKNIGEIEINPQYIPSDNLTNFNGWFEKDKSGKITLKTLKEVLVENEIINKNQSIESIKMSSNPRFESFIIENKGKIFRRQPSLPEDIKKESKKKPKEIISYQDNDGKTYYAQNGYRFAFLESSIKIIDGQEKVAQLLCDIWPDISFHGTQYEGLTDLPAGKKPERLIMRIFEMFTNKGDLVLDFFLGSGTTAAVAHKMGRQYIGVEQLDYGKNDSYIRVEGVINGDQTGISESVNRQGGGEFIYCELKKYNQEFIDKIEKAKDTKELLKIRELMKEKAYFKYNFDMQEFENSLDEFKNKTLEEQKEILVNILNKNQLYVNLSDIDDEDFAVSEEDKKLNDLFYNN